MKPPPSCKTPRECTARGLLERCRVCVETYYWESGLTVEEGDAWRESVLNPRSCDCCQPLAVTILPDGSLEVEGGDVSNPDALASMMQELAGILDDAALADNDNT